MYNNVYIKGNIYIYMSKYPNLPRDAIVRLTHLREEIEQGKVFDTVCWQTNSQLLHRVLKLPLPSLYINIYIYIYIYKISVYAILKV